MGEATAMQGSGVSWSQFVLRIASVGMATLGGTLLLSYPLGADHGVFAVIGQNLLEGGVPYRDAWDFKPPGIFLVFALAQWLFGPVSLGIRVLEVAAGLILCLLFGQMTRAAGASREIGWFAGGAAILLQASFGFWHTAQPEWFGCVFVAAGILLASSRSGVLGALACGACFGVAALFKPPLGGGALVAALTILLRGHGPGGCSARLAMLALGCALPSAAGVAALGILGAMDDVLWTFGVFTPNYTSSAFRATGMFQHLEAATISVFGACHPYVLPGMLLGLLVARRRLAEPLPLQLLGAAAMGILGVALQAKHYPYHITGLLPILLLVASLGMAAASQRWPEALRPAPLLAAVLLLGLAPGPVREARWRVTSDIEGWWRAKDAESLDSWRDRRSSGGHLEGATHRRAVERIRALVPEDASIFVWGFEPLLYWDSQRRPATRWIYNVAQRVEGIETAPRQSLMQDLRRESPALIVVAAHDEVPSVVGNTRDSQAELDRFPELQAFLAAYRIEEHIGDLTLWVRRS